MFAHGVNPILNVSDMQASFAWFHKLGWETEWQWGEPSTTFACVKSGMVRIFLCLNGQGGRGHNGKPQTFGENSDESTEQGVWMSLWVDNVDAIHDTCKEQGIEITWPPTDEPWGVREMHIRHPDGHVFRIGCGIRDDDDDDCE